MGQYYLFANLTKKASISPDGAKMKEHSYFNNRSLLSFFFLLQGDWCGNRTVQFGDYSDPIDVEGEETTYEMVSSWKTSLESCHPSERARALLGTPHVRAFLIGASRTSPQSRQLAHRLVEASTSIKWKEIKPFFVSFDKREYVDLKSYKYEIAPVILIASGCGKGGGDYFADEPDFELVGCWAGDRVGIVAEVPEGFTQLSPRFGKELHAPTDSETIATSSSLDLMLLF